MRITILEQGIWPDDKPPLDATIHIYDKGDQNFYQGHTGELVEGERWIRLSKPEKALEDHTEAELIEKWVKKHSPNLFAFNPQTQTLSEALIDDLK